MHTVFLVLCLSVCACAFFFPTGEPAKAPADAVDLTTRGILNPEKYAGQTFSCDGGTNVIARGKVNDNFCDCADGSDEPGTSACPGNKFFCKNEGYRIIELYSSRVDDGICDCCDGSDEGFVVKCTNTCEEVGRAERAAMAEKRLAYETGSRLRESYISEVKTSTLKELDRHDVLQPEHDGLVAEIQTLREATDKMSADVDAKKAQLRRASRAANADGVFAAVGLTRLSTDVLAEVVVAFATVVQPSVGDVLQALDPEGGDEDKYDIMYDDDEDDATREKSHTQDNAERRDEEEGAANENKISVSVGIKGCILEDAMRDSKGEVVDLMEEVCKHVPANHTTAPEFLRWFLVELAATVSDSSSFTKLHAVATHPEGPLHTNSVSTATTASIEAPPPHLTPEQCAVHGDMPAQLMRAKSHTGVPTPTLAASGLPEAEAKLEVLRGELRQRTERESEVKAELDKVNKLAQNYKAHSNDLEWMYLQDQCFSVQGGEYTYNVCIMGTATQSGTSLGKFKDLTRRPDGSVVMEYTNGNHCHAFGARRATVTATCGAENKVLVVDEPSTCYYTFQMLSPAACSPDVGGALGM